MNEHIGGKKRVLLLLSPATYRAGAFQQAAEKLGLEVAQGVDMAEELAAHWRVPLALRFADPDAAVATVLEYAREHPLDAVLSVDDSATILAARIGEALGLPHNSPDAAVAARDKYEMRRMLAAGHVRVPRFERFPLNADPTQVAQCVPYPCVLKPLRLSGSRGVMRADDAAGFIVAWRRLARMLLAEGNRPEQTHVLVEAFIPGFEVALEGILTGGALLVLALFDKPDPLDGPFFEETIYVTPSRLPIPVQEAIAAQTQQAAAALGVRTGPVHAELRVNDHGAWLVEMAGRSIGGHCSDVLRFGADMCLEELILRHSVGLDIHGYSRDDHAAGVMMIPIPRAGMLASVAGVEEARAVPGIEDVRVTAKLNQPLVPLPEGASYLGFIFAHGDDPARVEAALRAAHGCLRFSIKPHIPLLAIGAL